VRYVLERQQSVNRPRPEVFAFFVDAANLERLTPSSMHFHILTPVPIDMRAGAIIDYRIALFGLPMKWRTLIEAFEPDTRFIDVQTRGPYTYWRHTHTFADTASGGTSITDHVEYELPLGVLGRAVHALFVREQLQQIFDFRQRTISDLFG
jgi:ligand-binding SRPBCC domain-containing protein